jgi:hypothetical protein
MKEQIMAYDDELLNDDERLVPAEDFYEHLGNAEMGDDTDDASEELVADEDMDEDSAESAATPAASDLETNRGFRERLDDPAGSVDDDFSRSIDPEQNPYIGDQLGDENLQHDGDDYQ